MFIVAVTACPTGVAHTYMAREKLVQAAQKRGIEIKVETQGSTGRESEITADDVARADAAIIAADVTIAGMERFAELPTLECSLAEAIKKTNNLFNEVIEAVS